MFFISAGHYPTKPGACFGSFCEFDEASLWVELVARAYNKIRHTKEWLPELMCVPAGVLKDKIAFINARAPLFALEIHFNSCKEDGKHVGRGSETLYFPGSTTGLACAGIVQENIGDIFSPDRGPKEGYYRCHKDFGPDYFLKQTACPSLIVEPEFIHNKNRIQANRNVATDALAIALTQIYTRVLEAR